MISHGPLAWSAFFLCIFILLFLDLKVLHRNIHEISYKEALLTSLGYVVISFLFNIGIFYTLGHQQGFEFFTGYFIEKSLSLDNIFIFSVIFTQFRIPLIYQHRVLYWGVLGAIVMRGVLIFLGAKLITQFHFMMALFSLFLIFTGFKMLFLKEKDKEFKNHWLVLFLEKYLPFTRNIENEKFIVKRSGKFYMTPLLMVLILVELTDVIFALDSIPAIFAVTTDPFIVYTTNIFAILGLRSLYFALAKMVKNFHYLKYGLALVMLLVGFKMLVNWYFDKDFIPIELTLILTIFLIMGSALLSYLKPLKRS
ncbi:TerC/Alx family metal homeostasis membrane protein [Candidatus Nucleicultrix amoebiphila]|jgi:tellurite resistance protein TerC|uniref:TerC/Alx family metal homeostasis membrane protein n=1 Tax=Candidatus Nucleicultrix amoebiphila TaxID=1509244 RepID=UPI000A26FC28|nr:TerC/Alx family metal homeostasis membrane protein [Candidatus Nucleicultrix amoebiphila]